jgi:hypothetical protein
MADDSRNRDYDLDDVLTRYRLDGTTVREKARLTLDEQFMPQAWRRMADEHAPTSTIVELAKVLIDLGDMKPKPSTTPTNAPGFSITINIPQSDGKPPIVIEGETIPTADDTQDSDEIPGTNPTALLPPDPVNFNTPAMDFAVGLPGESESDDAG